MKIDPNFNPQNVNHRQSMLSLLVGLSFVFCPLDKKKTARPDVVVVRRFERLKENHPLFHNIEE